MRDAHAGVRIPEGSSPSAAADRVMAVLRPVCGALVLGVASFGGVAAWMFLTGAAPLSPGALPSVTLVAAAAATPVFFVVASTIERGMREAPEDATMTDVAGRYQTATIVGFALREAPGLFGTVLALLLGSLAWAVGFAAASALAMAVAWPKRDDLEGRLRRVAARG